MLLKTILDFSGAILSFVSTICFVRTNIWGWPLGLLSCLINLVLYLKVGIYADAFLRLIFFFLLLYGWYTWLYGGKDQKKLPISQLTKEACIKLVWLGGLGFVVVYFVLTFYTDSKLPFWDAITTILALIAQWLAGKKVKQNWYIWLIVDTMTCGMCLYKGIFAHALLYFVYLTIALIGSAVWQKRLLKQEENIGDLDEAPA